MRWREAPTMPRAVLLGLALGLSATTKFSAIAFVGVTIALGEVARWLSQRRGIDARAHPRLWRSAIVSRSCEGIDARGLHRTNLDALRDALVRVSADVPAAEVICLSDGFPVRDLGREQRAIVDGDCTSAAIAAASILAKVSRDRFMVRADERHPGWSFAEHKGYSSPLHREAILRQGVSPLHRMSFASTAYQQLTL
jgi:ribonuclease HII